MSRSMLLDMPATLVELALAVASQPLSLESLLGWKLVSSTELWTTLDQARRGGRVREVDLGRFTLGRPEFHGRQMREAIDAFEHGRIAGHGGAAQLLEPNLSTPSWRIDELGLRESFAQACCRTAGPQRR